MPDPLRMTFDEVAETYDRVRPTYPDEVFDDLARLCELRKGSRVVEIGPGTGQATLPLAARGFRVTAVELGETLAGLARRNLAPYSDVEVINADFETWQPGEPVFDAVVAFTSFHWLDAAQRYEKAAKPLREGGGLAVLETKHVLPADGDPFFAEVQEDYAAVNPSDSKSAAEDPAAVDDLTDEIAASGYFRAVAVRRYLWDITYTADEYIAVLETYSNNRALDPALRTRLYERIRRRIRGRPNGTVRKTHLAILNVAQRG